MMKLPTLAERLGPAGSRRSSLLGCRHMVSAGHQGAAHAGFLVLEAGGNAVDAGVAAGIALGVLQSDVVNFAGVAPILFYSASDGRFVSIPGLGGWPGSATAQYFIDTHGGTIPENLARTVVPAAPAAWITALRRYGTMSFGEVASVAVAFAVEGFPTYPMLADSIAAHRAQYSRWDSNAAIYLPGGQPPAIGSRFVQKDLGSLIQHMINEERARSHLGRDEGLVAAHDAFYKGDIAAEILSYHRHNGGLLQPDDLSSFEVGVEEPVFGSFLGSDVVTCGSWCQGPLLIQLLNVLENADFGPDEINTAGYIHQFVEATKKVFEDRERYYGDPDYVDVPLERLLSKSYAKELHGSIDPGTSSHPGALAGSGSPSGAAPFSDRLDTSYLCVVDRAGNVFSATPSDVSYDTQVIPGLGICPSSRGSQSWLEAGHPSIVEPGKRPRLTPNPAMIRLSDGSIMPFGTPGGDVQVQAMAQFVVNVVKFGMSPQAACETPRFASASFPSSFWPHESFPGKLLIESRVPESVSAALTPLGHNVDWWPGWEWKAGGICAILRDQPTGTLVAAADPRRPAYAVGW